MTAQASIYICLFCCCCCTAAVSFYGDGYIYLRTVETSIQTLIHVRFRTSSQSGLLLLAAGHTDFMLLELISGYLQVGGYNTEETNLLYLKDTKNVRQSVSL